jgi:hypothetical protein
MIRVRQPMSPQSKLERATPSATFGHAGYGITVEIIKPRFTAYGVPAREARSLFSESRLVLMSH